MWVLTRKTIRAAAERHPSIAGHLQTWYKTARGADWDSPHALKRQYPKASILSNNRVVFDIRGGDYRLVAHINYDKRRVYIRFIGTHAEYDRIDAEVI